MERGIIKKYIIGIACIFVILSGCNNTTNEESAREKEIDLIFPENNSGKRTMSFTIDRAEYIPEDNLVLIELDTNLPDMTEVEVSLNILEETSYSIAILDNLTTEVVQDGTIQTEFVPEETRPIPNGEYEIGLSVELQETKNSKLLNILEEGIGYYLNSNSSYTFGELEDEFNNDISMYQNSESVEIELQPEAFTVSNAHTMEEFQVALENEENLSQEFSDYNRKYYVAFKNNLDLIGSNFELIYDGFSSPDLIDDLIMWTQEFNELLDVYEQNAIPQSEIDHKLFNITNEMNSEQREANEYILQGLKKGDDQSLVIAGEYLKTTTDLFREGNLMVE